jgi:hypothetical protein
MNLLKLLTITAVGLVLTAVPLCLAGEKEELAAINAMIAIVESGKKDQAKEAEELFDSIAVDSKMKPVAAYSLALVQLREHQFSEAWKSITTPTKEQDSVSDSVKLGKERLKLWLLLEAGAAEKAEPQFKRLVTMTLGADDAVVDQTVSCGFVGGVVGMLKSNPDSSCIPMPILEKAKELLLAKVEAKNATTELDLKFADANTWGGELSSLVGKYSPLGAAKADEQNKLRQTEFERAKQEQLKLRDDLKSAGGDKRDLDDQRRKKIQERKGEQENLLKEKKNQPAPPVNPGPQPPQPTKPTGEYKTDPRTQERKLEKPTASEEREYQQKLALFNSWPIRATKFQRDTAEYQGKVQLWQQRVAACEARVKAVDDAIKATESAMKSMQEDIKQGVGKDLKDAGDQLEQLERLAAISNIAYNHIVSNDPKTKNMIRPSNFRLLDYAAESVRLRKSVR